MFNRRDEEELNLWGAAALAVGIVIALVFVGSIINLAVCLWRII